MSYIGNHLMSGEEVVREARLNRIIYLPAGILLLAAVGVFGWAYFSGNANSQVATAVPVALLALAIVVAIPAFIRRSSSEFAVTNKRVVVKVGLVRRHSTEILLRQVEGITVDQTILGRIFGYGTITIEGTGSDRTPYGGIAAPLKFRLAVQEQIESSLSGRSDPVRAPDPGSDAYSRILKLNELREKGALTDEEFAREKRRLLGEA